MVLGSSMARKGGRTFCLLGDGELDEGSVHEAIAIAGRMGLDRLTAIVVDNHSATHGWPGGIASRFSGEGWVAVEADGRDHDDIERALSVRHDGAPLAVIARVGRRDG